MRFKGILSKGILIMLLAAAIIVLCAITSIYGGGEKKNMEPMYEIKKASALTPQIYSIGDMSGLSLFPVPQDNAVGTNDYADAITIISFPKGKMEIDKYFKRAADNIRGGGTYLPVISKDMIGFGQTRRFLLYNFKTKKCEDYDIVISIHHRIQNIAIADASKRIFLFEMKEHNRRSVDPWDFTKSLRLIDLSENKISLLKKFQKEQGSTWTVAYDRLFLWFFTKKEMQVLDMNLEPSQHPLGDAIKRNKDKTDFTRMAPHPSLPFAILYAGKTGTTTLNWGEGRAKTPLHLFSSVRQFSFSPDGKWVTFEQGGLMDDKKTYIMPVSEKYPNFLGTPILLCDHSFTSNHYAWTNNPVSFVGSYGDKLYRWELTNEAHPESNKPTFHDYLVEKDLEKLAK